MQTTEILRQRIIGVRKASKWTSEKTLFNQVAYWMDRRAVP